MLSLYKTKAGNVRYKLFRIGYEHDLLKIFVYRLSTANSDDEKSIPAFLTDRRICFDICFSKRYLQGTLCFSGIVSFGIPRIRNRCDVIYEGSLAELSQ